MFILSFTTSNSKCLSPSSLFSKSSLVHSTSLRVSVTYSLHFATYTCAYFTDPLMAHISDNLTKTKYGRRLPYMMLCPLYSIAFLILVSPPKDDKSFVRACFFVFKQLVIFSYSGSDVLVRRILSSLLPLRYHRKRSIPSFGSRAYRRHREKDWPIHVGKTGRRSRYNYRCVATFDV